ncbi:MAG: NUDIX hydrolase [Acidimicrobiia bacterium]|nr:NUDIX hydrolase [Acidimicrobiia bacterium]NNF68714.1 NUDIX hydrolase [Acidimicrobiia bacterium]
MPRREGLRALLAAYPVPSSERTTFAAMNALTGHPGDPLSRSTFNPGHFTASAFVLSPLRDSVLLVHHQKLSRWLQPGGHIDPEDADVISAARREVLEETGLTVATLSDDVFDIDIHTYPPGREPEHAHFDIRFLFGADSLEVPGSDEIDDWRWVGFEEIESVDDDPSLTRPFEKARRWVGSDAS